MIPVKVCGITSTDDALFSIRSGALAIGMIFFDNSPRNVDIETAKAIVEIVPLSVAKVGVFVNEKLKKVREIADVLDLDFVQLHGDESPDFCVEVEKPVIKAIRVKDDFPLDEVVEYRVHAFLLDTYKKNIHGGTGSVFNWNNIKIPEIEIPIILSGGLTPFNILDGIRIIKPAAVDVNSGVEVYPGKKDTEKVENLFKKLSATGSYKNIFKNITW